MILNQYIGMFNASKTLKMNRFKLVLTYSGQLRRYIRNIIYVSQQTNYVAKTSLSSASPAKCMRNTVKNWIQSLTSILQRLQNDIDANLCEF